MLPQDVSFVVISPVGVTGHVTISDPESLVDGRHNVFIGIVNNKMSYIPLDEAVKKKQRISEEWMKIVKILAT